MRDRDIPSLFRKYVAKKLAAASSSSPRAAASVVEEDSQKKERVIDAIVNPRLLVQTGKRRKMKTKKKVSRSPCQKGKLCDSPIDKDDSGIDPSYKLFQENLQMETKKTLSRSPPQNGKLCESLIATDDSEKDPSYKLFLENLRIDGDTYVLDVPKGDHGKHVYVRYEEEDTTYGIVNKDKNDTDFHNSSLRRSRSAPNGKQLRETPDKVRGRKVGHSFSPWTSSMKKKMKTSPVDESYELFLSLVKFKDDHMVIEPEPGVTIVYEQEEDMPARCELRAGSSTNGTEPLKTPSENMEEYAVCASEDSDLEDL